MPKYDFRCDACGSRFELTRSFAALSAPAICPYDGGNASRLFSPPQDVLLFHRREPVVPTGRAVIPPGALSCHDHGPPPDLERDDAPSGSRWHATGYDGSNGHEEVHSHAHGHGYDHSHSHPHAHSHGHGHPH